MLISDIANWIKTEFLPVTLATDDTNITQQINNAIRYWNNNSGFKASQMVNFSPGTMRVQLSPSLRTVAYVYPNKSTTWIWNDLPLWSLVGITILDNITTDMIMMSEAFRNYRTYVGTDFRWMFEKNDDPTQGGWLYVNNAPKDTTRLFVVGVKRILIGEDIISQHVLDWVLRYSKALVKIAEGNSLRKSSAIGITNDGTALVEEGKAEKKELEEFLMASGRWLAMARRF